jgi:hypothetical protein
MEVYPSSLQRTKHLRTRDEQDPSNSSLPNRLLKPSTSVNGFLSPITATMAAPPPYHLDAKVTEDSGLSEKASALKLFIFEIIAFAYGADRNALLKAYTSSSVAVPRFEVRHTKEERDNYFALSQIVKQTQQRVPRNQLCAIPQSAYDTIYTELILPCIELNANPAYVSEWLQTYHMHEFKPKRRIKTIGNLPFFGTLFLCWWNQTRLGQGVTAADVYVESMSPNESVRMLLGAAIAEFGDRRLHWSEVYGRLRRERKLNPSKNATAMIKVVSAKARKDD